MFVVVVVFFLSLNLNHYAEELLLFNIKESEHSKIFERMPYISIITILKICARSIGTRFTVPYITIMNVAYTFAWHTHTQLFNHLETASIPMRKYVKSATLI